jgi:beta-glucosidase
VREVAQLYTHQRVSSLTKPVRELKAFQAVTLQAGQTMTVTFVLRRADLASVQPDLKTTAEPGWFDVVVAASASAGRFVAFRLVAAER